MPQSTHKQQPIDALKTHFGYAEFRPLQEEIIETILAAQDVLAIMPTGGGKSICYQLPALLFSGLTIVVSPLIALMKDQVDGLRLQGISAAFLNSSQSVDEQRDVWRLLHAGALQLLYLSPERLFAEERPFVEALDEIALFAIDEAHCISQWGHDFRPEYLKLAGLKERFPAVPVAAFTATADRKTREDITRHLNLKDPAIYISSFNRENIHYRVQPKMDSRNKLVNFLSKRRGESGIVYALSRKSTEQIAELLNDAGFSAKAYHAGMDHDRREAHQELFSNDDVRIIVATTAFGMGIDKSNVRFVVHMDLPKNIESYYQETGRAGRDGLPSQALLFFSRGDAILLRKFIEIEDDASQSRIMIGKLNQMIAYGESRQCRRQFLLAYFGEEHAGNCGSCDVCETVYERFDGTVIAQKALSAVARLEGRFGMSYVIDFLRGSKAQRIKQWHRELKTYGVGADISKPDWRQYFRNLIDEGYLRMTDGEYPVLQLTQASAAVLKGAKSVMLVRLESKAEAETLVPDHDAALFERLRSVRRQLALREGVPSYLIFSDKSLVSLATYLPLTTADLALMPGFGDVKIERYGSTFLSEIEGYVQAHDLTTRMERLPVSAKKRRKKRKPQASPSESVTKAESLSLFLQGLNIIEIANTREMTTQTIEDHLVFYVSIGRLKPEELMDASKIERIRAAIQESGQKALRPVKQHLGAGFSYGEIKIVWAWMKHQGL